MNSDYLLERKDLVPLDDGTVVGHKALELATTKIDGETGEPFAVLSTATVDSYGDIIEQGKNEKGAGWDLVRFNRAPVLLWVHNIWGMNLSAPGTRAVVAKGITVADGSTVKEALVLDRIRFDMEDELAAQVDGKIRRGIIKENSVGFVARISEMIRDEESDRPIGVHFFEQELMEDSFVNRGANPDTTVLVKSMLGCHPELAAKADTRDNAAAELARAELDDTMRGFRGRFKTIEEALSRLSNDQSAFADLLEARKEVEQERLQAAWASTSDLVDRLNKFAQD